MTLPKQQQEWHDKCYAIWKSPGTRTKRAESEARWKQLKVTEELFNEIYEWILAFNRYQKAANESTQYNSGFQVFLNPKKPGWINDIPSISEEKAKQEIKRCQCGKESMPVTPSRKPTNQCLDCYYKKDTGEGYLDWRKEHFDKCKAMGVLEKATERTSKIMALTPRDRAKWLLGALSAATKRVN